ncbi:CBS domain-containing protein [Nocardia cyriacigeorgica]|uniref:CBS domain-containing protein n=1 Tax=Nocardia cyriacigeorgica TaxID=135487 RepID=A0A6P1D886_9NOCA|nr:CBS domain-containing protein [Nocardia cyriacigeorgica]NEW46896.1 CBS domain-containing protein [Nocardia cyriacigeorgica]NEW48713.1 CBS domain-containing protein [Nocardia cyriacigeorgica]NEW56372.1 CBS domain-containing protein [Nocardia cyriacigeorgica]
MTNTEAVMHPDVACITVRDTMETAAQRMRQLDVGALPICDGEGRPVGIVTDRDIIIKVIALGENPKTTTAGELAQGDDLLTVDAATDITEAIALMEQHQIRRLPVTEQGRLVGIITEADLARRLPDQTVGEFVEAICAQHLPSTTHG